MRNLLYDYEAMHLYYFQLVFYKTYTASSVSKSTMIGMSPLEEIWKHGHKVSWIIASNRINQEISEKTFPTDEGLAELDDIINQYIRNQREEEMIRLLKENLEK